MNIGLFIGVFVVSFTVATALTFLYPDAIFPGYVLLMPGTSSLRDSILHASRILLNGLVYGLSIGFVVVAGKVMIAKGKKILQN